MIVYSPRTNVRARMPHSTAALAPRPQPRLARQPQPVPPPGSPASHVRRRPAHPGGWERTGPVQGSLASRRSGAAGRRKSFGRCCSLSERRPTPLVQLACRGPVKGPSKRPRTPTLAGISNSCSRSCQQFGASRAGPEGGGAGSFQAKATPGCDVVGRQAGGDLGFYPCTNNVAAQHARRFKHGATFRKAPRVESQGTAAIIEHVVGMPREPIGPAHEP